MKTADLSVERFAEEIATMLAECDGATLRLVADRLVNRAHAKADTLEFALASVQREYLMAHGFGEKINS